MLDAVLEVNYKKNRDINMEKTYRYLHSNEATIHKFINSQALKILKNDNLTECYSLFQKYIKEIDRGVRWADADFKNSGHFYNPNKKRGLRGRKNALSLAEDYYTIAVSAWDEDVLKAMFFLGAAAHLVQDLTIPQHASGRLLKEHHKYEKYIKETYLNTPEYLAQNEGCYLKDVEEFVIHNATKAIKLNQKFKNIKDEQKRYYGLTKQILPLAQRTTAGLFYAFYSEVNGHNQEN
jgi:phospholipase C